MIVGIFVRYILFYFFAYMNAKIQTIYITETNGFESCIVADGVKLHET